VSPLQELNEFGAADSIDADNRTRAFFKIQDGCDYKCSFCTIPMARGKSRSMNPDELIFNFEKLISRGYKEIILTGVNVGDYGKVYSTNLYSVLLKMIQIHGDFRIRISSIEPNLLSDEIINLTASSEKMCKHFHIPLQSGSADILKLMKRRYNISDYASLIYKLKNKIPDIGIGVDVIAGFPGETEENFVHTYNFLRNLPVSYLHVFTYSERPGTKAITMPGQVDIAERRKRNNMLRILSDKKKYAFYTEMIGKELEVLFEEPDGNSMVKGFSSNYVRVSHTFSTDMINNFSNIAVSGIEGNICSGELKGIKKSIELIAS
jgi:threonylcarbamoyladenosine tRNA methylthiotransferase MtaB